MALGIIPSPFRVLNSVKDKIKNYFACNKVRKFYLFFYSAVFIVHLFLPLNLGDDAIFFEKSSLLSLKEFLSGSARPIIDAFTYFFTKFPLLRRIINLFILIAESLILSKYLPPKSSYLKTVILSHALLFPSIIVVDAGFIATTLNYLWAVTFGLISLIPVQEQMNNQKISCFEKRRHAVLRMSSFYYF